MPSPNESPCPNRSLRADRGNVPFTEAAAVPLAATTDVLFEAGHTSGKAVVEVLTVSGRAVVAECLQCGHRPNSRGPIDGGMKRPGHRDPGTSPETDLWSGCADEAPAQGRHWP